MDYTAIIITFMNYASMLLGIMFLLTFTVNIIVEVVKRLVPKVPTDIVVFVISIAITILALYITASIMKITVMWYYAVGAVILGVFVAYAANCLASISLRSCTTVWTPSRALPSKQKIEGIGLTYVLDFNHKSKTVTHKKRVRICIIWV